MHNRATYLAESLSFCMFLEAESWEVNAMSKNASFGQNTDTSDTIDLHFHIWITVRVPEVSQVWPPGGVLSITLDNHGVFV